jgi:hypothetical protein
MLHDQQILLDYDLANPSKILKFKDLRAILTVNFGIYRIPSLPRLLIDDYGSFIDLNIDVSIEVIELELYVLLDRCNVELAQFGLKSRSPETMAIEKGEDPLTKLFHEGVFIGVFKRVF